MEVEQRFAFRCRGFGTGLCLESILECEGHPSIAKSIQEGCAEIKEKVVFKIPKLALFTQPSSFTLSWPFLSWGQLWTWPALSS